LARFIKLFSTILRRLDATVSVISGDGSELTAVDNAPGTAAELSV
jgi:hypothetical protein